MKYAALKKNDIANAPGICVSFYTQGCPHRCPGCHNPDTWSFDGGKEFTPEVMNELLEALEANGVHRNLCILGGEPLCQENLFLTSLICQTVREKNPTVKIYIWTGYTIEELRENITNPKINNILNGTYADVLIDGRFEIDKKDLNLEMRGSSNQRIIQLT